MYNYEYRFLAQSKYLEVVISRANAITTVDIPWTPKNVSKGSKEAHHLKHHSIFV
jgi:hypothetical protein